MLTEEDREQMLAVVKSTSSLFDELVAERNAALKEVAVLQQALEEESAAHIQTETTLSQYREALGRELKASKKLDKEVQAARTLKDKVALAVKHLNDGFKAPEEMRLLALEALK